MSNIGTTIKSIQDIMRQDTGVDGDAQRISQLVWMLFLKIFDDKEQEYELIDDNYKSPVPEKLRWRNWAANEEGITGDELLDFINNELFKTLKELSIATITDPRGHIVKDVFEDSYNYMKSGTLIRQVINKINSGIDFTSSSDRHTFNDIYEQILKDLQSAGNSGEYYTPRAVTQFIVDTIAPKLGEKVMDAACGTGGFLVCAYEYMKNQVNNPKDKELLNKSLIGIDKKPLPHLLAITNLILHGIETPEIRRDNALARPITDYTAKDRVDVIIMNPPFGGVEEGIQANFPSSFKSKETADLFLILILTLLKDGGRAGIVLPDGTLFGEGVKTRIKEKLLEECNLHTIIKLPNGVFSPYTGIKTNILFFEKGTPTKEIWYFEHPYPQGVKSYNKTKPINIKEFDLEKDWWNNRVETEKSWKVSIDEIKARNFNLDCKNPNIKDIEHADPEELRADYMQTLDQLNKIKNLLREELMSSLTGKG